MKWIKIPGMNGSVYINEMAIKWKRHKIICEHVDWCDWDEEMSAHVCKGKGKERVVDTRANKKL